MPTNYQELKGELRKKRVEYWFRVALARTIDLSKLVVVVGGLLLVVLLQVPWLKEPLKQLGFTVGSEVGQAIVVFILAALFFEVRTLAERSDDTTEARHYDDPISVYPVLISRMRSIARDDQKTLDVLGMTLYTAWPTITFWLNKPELTNWTIRMAAGVYKDDAVGTLVPQSWTQESQANLQSIAQSAESPAITRRGIKLRPYVYEFMPALHGFRLGNGDLFYSLLQWQQDGRIGREKYSYEFVPHEDSSPTAEAMREIFDSWFERSTRTPWVG